MDAGNAGWSGLEKRKDFLRRRLIDGESLEAVQVGKLTQPVEPMAGLQCEAREISVLSLLGCGRSPRCERTANEKSTKRLTDGTIALNR